jgi:hypothetical protein
VLSVLSVTEEDGVLQGFDLGGVNSLLDQLDEYSEAVAYQRDLQDLNIDDHAFRADSDEEEMSMSEARTYYTKNPKQLQQKQQKWINEGNRASTTKRLRESVPTRSCSQGMQDELLALDTFFYFVGSTDVGLTYLACAKQRQPDGSTEAVVQLAQQLYDEDRMTGIYRTYDIQHSAFILLFPVV